METIFAIIFILVLLGLFFKITKLIIKVVIFFIMIGIVLYIINLYFPLMIFFASLIWLLIEIMEIL
jgi:hypothetical protein